jgi:hypothetical protein
MDSFREAIDPWTISPIRNRVNEDEDAIKSEDEEEEVPENAIDHSGDWENSVSAKSRYISPDKQLFQKIDSRQSLQSRESLLTTALHESQQTDTLAAAATCATPTLQHWGISSPNCSCVAVSPENDQEHALTIRDPDIPRSKPVVVTKFNTHPAAHSPQTIRRNMITTELTGSLQKNVLWERQQKNTTANAVYKRRHTSIEITKLQDYPGPKPKHASKNNSWSHYFDYGSWESVIW